MDDPPAAHSMDTDWFAVDGEGHVGCFATGEDGPLPTEGAAATTVVSGRQAGAILLASNDDVVRYAFAQGWLAADASLLETARAPVASPASAGPYRGELPDPARHSFYVRAREYYDRALARWQAIPWWRRLGRAHVGNEYRPHPRAYEGFLVLAASDVAPAGTAQKLADVQVVWVSSMDLDELAELHLAGRCRACAAPGRAFLNEGDDALAQAGLFAFRTVYGYCSPVLSPYERTRVAPARPRRLEDFDPEFVRRLAPIALPEAHFARDARVQPARWVRCMSWVDPSPAYLDTDLRTVRPQRGMEATFAAMRATLLEGSHVPESEAWVITDGGDDDSGDDSGDESDDGNDGGGPATR